MVQLHYPRLIKVGPNRWRSACHCGWLGAAFLMKEDAYDSAVKHISMHNTTCADCGDVREPVLWEKDAHSWVLCPACAKQRTGQELRVLQAELAV